MIKHIYLYLTKRLSLYEKIELLQVEKLLHSLLLHNSVKHCLVFR